MQSQNASSSFKEWDWSGPFNSANLEWQQLHEPSRINALTKAVGKLSLLGRLLTFGKTTASTPPLFRVSDLLKVSSSPQLRKISKVFNDKLWVTNNFLPQIVRGINEEPVEIGSKRQRELFQILIHFDHNEEGMKVHSAGCLSIKDAAVWRQKLSIERERKEKQDGLNVMLWDTQLRAPVTNTPISLEELRSSRDLQTAEVAFRMLNGNVNIPKELIPLSKELLSHNGMEEAIHEIHANRGTEPFAGSDIDHILSELHNIPIEERL